MRCCNKANSLISSLTINLCTTANLCRLHKPQFYRSHYTYNSFRIYDEKKQMKRLLQNFISFISNFRLFENKYRSAGFYRGVEGFSNFYDTLKIKTPFCYSSLEKRYCSLISSNTPC